MDDWPTPGEMLLASIKLTALGLALIDLFLAAMAYYGAN